MAIVCTFPSLYLLLEHKGSLTLMLLWEFWKASAAQAEPYQHWGSVSWGEKSPEPCPSETPHWIKPTAGLRRGCQHGHQEGSEWLPEIRTPAQDTQLFPSANTLTGLGKAELRNEGNFLGGGHIDVSGGSPREGAEAHSPLPCVCIPYNKTVIISTVLLSEFFELSVQFSHSVVSNSLWPHGLQHTRLPCPSPTPGVCSNSCLSSQWCHPTISSSVLPFSCLQSFPATGSFPISQFFASGGQSFGFSASTW